MARSAAKKDQAAVRLLGSPSPAAHRRPRPRAIRRLRPGGSRADVADVSPPPPQVHPARARQQCLPSAVQRARARLPDESRTMVVPCVAWADRSPPTGTYFLAALQVAPTWVEGRLPHGVTAIALGNPRDERTVSHIHAYGRRRRGPGRSQGNGCAKHETFFSFTTLSRTAVRAL